MRTRAFAVVVRRAVATDQPAITKLVRAAGINPTGLHWQRFLVAASAGGVIGTVQLKPHRDGSCELASLAVAPAYQNRRIGGVLIRAVLGLSRPPIYLTCVDLLEPYYKRFGFRRLTRREMPPDLRRIDRIGNLLLPLLRPGRRLLVMGRCS
jgi:N-acetylglutamate synthase-like GNAT family acetyltransferase